MRMAAALFCVAGDDDLNTVSRYNVEIIPSHVVWQYPSSLPYNFAFGTSVIETYFALW